MIKKIKNIIKPAIKFKTFSKKQMQILTWWCENSPYKNHSGIICDGSIRAGKTVPMAISFIIWAMQKFDGQNFAMCGKTVGSFKRNVWKWLKPVLILRGFAIEEDRTTNIIYIQKKDVINYFYIFGGRDESSQDLIQGITLAGVLFDEVALMPESFVNQATGRCSVFGAKLWFNCNPESPVHYFYTEWLQKSEEKKFLHIHFRMEDNPSLMPEVIESYKSRYAGVFFQRFILGLWVMAQGAIYKDSFDDDNLFGDEKIEYINKNMYKMRRYIWIDYGTINPMVYLDVYDDGRILYVVNEYYYDSKKTGREKTDTEYGEDLIKFIGTKSIKPMYIVIDPSAASFKAQLRSKGFRGKAAEDTINADNKVLDGIRHVSVLLKKKMLLFHKENCTHTINELKSYVWDDKALQNQAKEKPLKIADHGPDAVRYGCYTLINPRRYNNAS